MNLSIWRYSHLVLALCSSALLTLAALTGMVLALEPVLDAGKGYRPAGMDTLRLSHVVPALRSAYPSIQQLRVDAREFVAVKWTDDDGKAKEAFVDPQTGRVLGAVAPRKPFFEWTMTLHRSLFLHETGRMIMGVTAALLVLIVISGIGLLLQRHKGLRGFFAPVERTGFSPFYHVVSGRLMLFFILALALTGGYLSLSRFVLKPARSAPKVDTDNIREEPQIAAAAFPVFRETKLSDIRSLDFPFSEFPEDYYTLKTAAGEQSVNQFTGEILATERYSRAYRLNEWSMAWHTGQSSAVWAVVMGLSSGYVLFFIYTGFAITIQRRRGRGRNRYKAAEAEIVILVGSENGSTLRFARSVYRQLLEQGRKAYVEVLNDYRSYPRARQLIIMTSTHGQGDPPANATRFLARLERMPQDHPVGVSVLGFGSRSYAQFCRFALDVDVALQGAGWAGTGPELMTVNDRSLHEFGLWLEAWSGQTGLPLSLDAELGKIPAGGLRSLAVVARTAVNADGAFTIRLKPRGASRFRSGDLLAIYPDGGHTERLYSIARVGRHIQLSVRLHHEGLGSGYLYGLNPGAQIRARVISNGQFHFPETASQVIMIANGTGVAPFQGMIAENRRGIPCYLYCGFRTTAGFAEYAAFLETSREQGRLREVRVAYSREAESAYVSTLLDRDPAVLWTALQGGAVIMVCGSCSMLRDVLVVIDRLCIEHTGADSTAFAERGQILTDCY